MPFVSNRVLAASYTEELASFSLSLYGRRIALTQPNHPQLSTDAKAHDTGREGVRTAIEHYLRGHVTGDPTHMRRAFLPTAHIEGIREGTFTSWTLDEYCSLFLGAPAADEATRSRTIDAIDVSGTAASARATLIHGATTFTDYFVLLNVNGEWKIANKVYYGQPT